MPCSRGNIKNLSVAQIEQGLKNAPSAEAGNEKKNIVDFLVDTKIEPSKRQAREDVKNGAIYVNTLDRVLVLISKLIHQVTLMVSTLLFVKERESIL